MRKKQVIKLLKKALPDYDYEVFGHENFNLNSVVKIVPIDD